MMVISRRPGDMIMIPNGRSRAKEPPQHDEVFFTKGQVSVGGSLVYYGRMAPKTFWHIEKIVSHRFTGSGVLKREEVETVRFLSDVVYLSRRGGTRDEFDHRQLPFSYLSYSAIWRVRD